MIAMMITTLNLLGFHATVSTLII